MWQILGELVGEHLHSFEELIEMKDIFLKTQMVIPANITLNMALADVLVSNLLNNALKHSYEGGEIIISVKNKQHG